MDILPEMQEALDKVVATYRDALAGKEVDWSDYGSFEGCRLCVASNPAKPPDEFLHPICKSCPLGPKHLGCLTYALMADGTSMYASFDALLELKFAEDKSDAIKNRLDHIIEKAKKNGYVVKD